MALKAVVICVLVSCFLLIKTEAFIRPVYKKTPPPPPPPAPPLLKSPPPPPPPPVNASAPPSPPVKASPPTPVKVPPPIPPPTVYTPPPPPTTPSGPTRIPRACIPPCLVRCKFHSRKNVCLRACFTCCQRCKCVPPGQYGNREKCGNCYAQMTTRGGKLKCP